MGDELVVLGVPVYEGRVAKPAVPRLQRLNSDQTPAVVVVVYGNRAFEDALLELGDLARDLGFVPIAGGAFIGEHSFANETRPMANGRPDADDMGKAREFGSKIRDKLAGMTSTDEVSPIDLPGDTPYIDRDRSALAEMAARTLDDACTLCGICEPLCPVGAITVEDVVKTDNLACIMCNACVKGCPEGARVVDDPTIIKIVNWVARHYQDRQEPQTFL
jgi:ferredoxin